MRARLARSEASPDRGPISSLRHATKIESDEALRGIAAARILRSESPMIWENSNRRENANPPAKHEASAVVNT
jgi:hypothetical protein